MRGPLGDNWLGSSLQGDPCLWGLTDTYKRWDLKVFMCLLKMSLTPWSTTSMMESRFHLTFKDQWSYDVDKNINSLKRSDIYVNKLTIIVSDNGLVPGRCQAIIWTNAALLLIESSGTRFSETLIKIHAFSLKKMHFKMSSVKWRSICLCLNVLKKYQVSSFNILWYRFKITIYS